MLRKSGPTFQNLTYYFQYFVHLYLILDHFLHHFLEN
jgi:hypothetical protein